MLHALKIAVWVSGFVLLNAVTTLLFVQSAAPVAAGPNNCVDGDVNGDSVVDITDPIHLLGYIFEGTPLPVACAQQPPFGDIFKLSGSSELELSPQTTFGCNTDNPSPLVPDCMAYPIYFGTDEFESGVLSASQSDVVIQEEGVYYLKFQLDMQMLGGTGDHASVRILRNGVVIEEEIVGDLVGRKQAQVETMEFFNAGDVLEFSFLPTFQDQDVTPVNGVYPRTLHSNGTWVIGYRMMH